ncbi:MAG: soluble lytic murein transglycosylase-like protein [Lysobacterales bacterium]|jgi:soluble lytic murein transglycosylase-like protein
MKFLICLLCLLVSGSVRAEIYKFTDAEGMVHYTNIKPDDVRNYKTFNFPCYASDPKCHNVDWEQVPLNRILFQDEIRTAASRYSVDEALIRAIIHSESAFQPDALSPKGAQGLMQLMPAMQEELEVVDPFDPASNIEGGSYHLSRVMQKFDGDVELTAAAYNAGLGAVSKYGGVPPYTETQEYVRRVQILYRRYRLSGS